MTVTPETKTRVIIDIRDLLQAALDEGRSLKQVLRELDAVIATRRQREAAQ